MRNQLFVSCHSLVSRPSTKAGSFNSRTAPRAPSYKMAPQPQVQLHPTNSRSAPASSKQQDGFSTPFFPRLDSLIPCPPRPTRRPSLTPTQSTYNTREQQQRPAAGLVQLDAQRFPLFSTQQGAAEIRVITAEQFTQLHHEYSLQKLPEEVLFPWLHGGADIPYSPASQYFGFSKGTAATPPRCVLFYNSATGETL